MEKMTKGEAGQLGGQAKTDLKRWATRQNLAKARSLKLLYRLNPSLKPTPKGDSK